MRTLVKFLGMMYETIRLLFVFGRLLEKRRRETFRNHADNTDEKMSIDLRPILYRSKNSIDSVAGADA